jgi:CheY-like chemotaxis protein
MNGRHHDARKLDSAELSRPREREDDGGLGGSPVRKLLLVVDDDTRTARRFAALLTEDGYDVEVLSNGTEAVERLAHLPAPSAIITDLVMPGVGGLAVLGEVRRRWSDVPVLFVTGHPELLARYPIPFEPNPIVFTKPLSYADFASRLRELVERVLENPSTASSSSLCTTDLPATGETTTRR